MPKISLTNYLIHPKKTKKTDDQHDESATICYSLPIPAFDPRVKPNDLFLSVYGIKDALFMLKNVRTQSIKQGIPINRVDIRVSSTHDNPEDAVTYQRVSLDNVEDAIILIPGRITKDLEKKILSDMGVFTEFSKVNDALEADLNYLNRIFDLPYMKNLKVIVFKAHWSAHKKIQMGAVRNLSAMTVKEVRGWIECQPVFSYETHDDNLFSSAAIN